MWDRFFLEPISRPILGIHFGSIFVVFRCFLGCVLVLFLVIFWSASKTEKVCLDCAGVGGLHVRPSTGMLMFMCFS